MIIGKKKRISKQRVKKGIGKILVALLTLVMVVSALPISGSAKYYYRTKSDVGSFGMNPSGDDLKNISGDDIWKGKSFSKTQCVYSAYAFNVVKFVENTLPSHSGPYANTGWYCFRTTGSCDTIGRLYTTHLNKDDWRPWNWYTEAKELAYSDDISFSDRNFKILYRMSEDETVYLATRLYSSKLGSFQVIAEPNNDAITSTNGGFWEVDDDGKCNVGGYYSTDITLQKLYMTKEQVATVYEIFRDKIADSTIARTRLKTMFYKNGYPATVEAVYSAVGEALISFAPKWVKTLKKFVGYLSNIISPVFEDALGLFLEDPEEIAKVCIKLEDVGGATKDHGKYTAGHGMLITQKHENFFGGYVTNLYYEEYDSNNLYGSDFEKGHWTEFDEDNLEWLYG